MKTKIYSLATALAVAAAVLSSCEKETATVTDDSAVVAAGAIAVGTTSAVPAAATASVKDSLYVVNCYNKRSKREPVAAADLPAAIGTYLSANYAGYTFKKAVKVTDNTTSVSTYIVVITVNSNPVGLKFTADGTFVSVLEQREGADLKGKGWHEGGRFCDRDGKIRDTIAISAIPVVVKSFFTSTYPSDTLVHAFKTPDTSYVLVSRNKGLFATNISAAGRLVKRIQISPRGGKHTEVAAAALPAVISSYLGTTYPGYTFKKAFSESANGAVREYQVFITSNSTNYVLEFDGSGTFVKARVLR